MFNRKIIAQVLIVLLLQCILGVTAFGNLITMIDAEQQAAGTIRYKDGFAEENPIEDHYDPIDPETPLGLENADLSVSFSNSGYSVSTSLITDLTSVENQITAEGSAFASAEWGSAPAGAWDVH